MTKEGSNWGFFELAKIESVPSLVLYMLLSELHSGFFIIFPNPSFPLLFLLLLWSWLRSLQVLMQAGGLSLEAIPSAYDNPDLSFPLSPLLILHISAHFPCPP